MYTYLQMLSLLVDLHVFTDALVVSPGCRERIYGEIGLTERTHGLRGAVEHEDLHVDTEAVDDEESWQAVGDVWITQIV